MDPEPSGFENEAHVEVGLEEVEDIQHVLALREEGSRLDLDELPYALGVLGVDAEEVPAFDDSFDVVPALGVDGDDGEVVVLEGL